MTHYFTKNTTAAIISWCAAKTQDKRDVIYNDHIHPAFVKLAEVTVTMRCKDITNENDRADVRAQLIEHFYDNLQKFDPKKMGANGAFSFFNRCAMVKVIILFTQRRKINNFEIHKHSSEHRENEPAWVESVADGSLNAEETLIEQEKHESKLSLMSARLRWAYEAILKNPEALELMVKPGRKQIALRKAMLKVGVSSEELTSLLNGRA